MMLEEILYSFGYFLSSIQPLSSAIFQIFLLPDDDLNVFIGLFVVSVELFKAINIMTSTYD